jgi:PBP1b-binding outer membrane lipoprotein LpoB
MKRALLSRGAVALCVLAASTALGCGSPSYVRGSEVEDLDDPAMSTGLDKRDLQKLLHDNLKSLMTSAAARGWNEATEKPRLAIYPIANETSEHIDSQLKALLSDMEGFMVESQLVRVISLERQRQLMAEIDRQHGGGYDPTKIAAYNKHMGAEVFITGKVYSSAERDDDERRVQYFMFLQVLDVATGEIKWQHKSELTKGLIDT